MGAMCSSEMSDNTQRTTRRYIPEDGTPHYFDKIAEFSDILSAIHYCNHF
jgi:hypothetical protein